MAVTVGNVTVVITDYQPKDRRTSSETASNDLSDSSDSASYTMNNDHEEDNNNDHHDNAEQDSETDTNSWAQISLWLKKCNKNGTILGLWGKGTCF